MTTPIKGFAGALEHLTNNIDARRQKALEATYGAMTYDPELQPGSTRWMTLYLEAVTILTEELAKPWPDLSRLTTQHREVIYHDEEISRMVKETEVMLAAIKQERTTLSLMGLNRRARRKAAAAKR